MEVSNLRTLSITAEPSKKISFCSVVYDIDNSIIFNLKKIIEIAEEIGFNYEIIIITEKDIDIENPNLRIIKSKFNSYGMAKSIAVAQSSGEYIIILNPELEYSIGVSDIIYKFINQNEKKALISNFTIINRDVIINNGGWRDLMEYEDIDLLVRTVASTGFIAYPSKTFDIFLKRNYKRNKQKYGIMSRLKENRDTIIACNLKLSDAFLFLDGSKLNILMSKFMEKFSGIKPFVFKKDKSNYIIVMETLIESLILEDYKKYKLPESSERMQISSKDYNYLKSKSYLWNKVTQSIEKITEIIN
ncbi:MULTISPECIES: hypothetical protein [Acidiplasma]|jgi:predicted DNA-binding protein (UPF0251 family)|uniref:Glycosyltransferase 2-like domain-containing protein n=3 Tax=Acidiplasma TaxID=507753 RepID=A0A0Q0RU29_9ARCH|nr:MULTISPECIES: hypothetical protein [Acidiplasma]KPV46553.1 hypothetical protein SE19_05005 [Acidiplasma aeolicum]KQB33552.1 hypothetical protein AOG55_02625 [Acidiplasma cupricumulans]KQB34761.1 hypothetical protein AOG54_00605 [Acidiplasma aeolicum]